MFAIKNTFFEHLQQNQKILRSNYESPNLMRNDIIVLKNRRIYNTAYAVSILPM